MKDDPLHMATLDKFGDTGDDALLRGIDRAFGGRRDDYERDSLTDAIDRGFGHSPDYDERSDR